MERVDHPPILTAANHGRGFVEPMTAQPTLFSNRILARKRAGVQIAATGAALICGALALPLWAQDGGLITYGIDSRLEAHDNVDLRSDPESSIQSSTRLSFGIGKETAASFIDLKTSALLRANLGGDNSDKEGLINPNLRLTFGRNSLNSGITGSLFARETELSGDIEAIDDFENATSGSRRDHGGSLSVFWGQDSRILWRLGTDARYSTYSDTPSYSNRRTLTYSGGASLAISDTTSLDIGLQRTDYSLDGQDSRISNGVTVDARIARPFGTLSIGLSLAETPEGNRQGLVVGHSLDMADGTFDARLGISRNTKGDYGWIGGLDYARDLPNGSLSLSLDHELSSSDETDRETEVTRLQASLSQDISERYSLSADIGVAEQSYPGSNASSIRRLRGGLSLNYDLGQDWRASAGIGHVQRRTDSSTTDDSSIYLGIRRSFQRGF